MNIKRKSGRRAEVWRFLILHCMSPYSVILWILCEQFVFFLPSLPKSTATKTATETKKRPEGDPSFGLFLQTESSSLDFYPVEGPFTFSLTERFYHTLHCKPKSLIVQRKFLYLQCLLYNEKERGEKKTNTTSTKIYIYISIFTCLYQVLIMDFRERDGVWFEGLFCWLVGWWLVGWSVGWLRVYFWRAGECLGF